METGGGFYRRQEAGGWLAAPLAAVHNVAGFADRGGGLWREAAL